MARDLIRYDLLVQDALKGVVRRVLGNAVKDGLPGEHHFYISFRTEFPGVRMSQRLRDTYPQEMTIVLQHQFWDLGVTEHSFEVGLSFSAVPERLLIPFDALTGFFDPSVSFGLKFEVQSETGSEPAEAPSSRGAQRLTRGAGSEPVELQPRKPAVPSIAKSALPRSAGVKNAAPKAVAPKLAVKPVEASLGAPKPDKPARTDAAQPPKEKDETGGTAEVVSLDSFRKKS